MPEKPELFISDPHGEYEPFAYIVRSGCGRVRSAIDALFGDAMSEAERAELATLAVYPSERIARGIEETADPDAWIASTFASLSALHGFMGGADPGMNVVPGPASIERLCSDIQRLAVGTVHVVGDVYDRGPAPDLIMDELSGLDDLDIQWGNHDILWMGAACGQRGSVANVVRICARYGNLSVLEDTYGIDLEPLRTFALEAYADDPCSAFGLKGSPDLDPDELAATVKVQKAMAIIQFKVEHQLIEENPSFGLAARDLLHRIDFEAGTVDLDGTVHELLDKVFPTVDPADPYRLTQGEQQVIDHLVEAFTGCEKLQRHIALFLEKGSLYKVCGDTLLFHACVPLNADGSLKQVTIYGQTLSGRALFDAVDGYVRDAYQATDPAAKKRGGDLLWYLWLGKGSPLFAKSKMATFELYFVADKAARKEVKNPFYSLLEDGAVLDGIFEDFGMDPAVSRIVCGHVPVKVKDGEDPVKCSGRALIIDGGMSRAYQSKTGVAGFTLVYDEKGARLATHKPFCGAQAAVATDEALASDWRELS